MEKIELGRYAAAVFKTENAELRPVIYIHTAAEECAEIFAVSAKAATLVCVSGIDWNADMSPWAAARAFKGGEDFAGGGGEYLRQLEHDIIPAVEMQLGFTPIKRGIAGYSLGGLFALWSIYNTELFSLAASASGSLWFDGWTDYIRANAPKIQPERVYISVGDREKNARDPRMRMVEDNSRLTAQLLAAKFELNEGNHFKDAPLRMARAIDYISGV